MNDLITAAFVNDLTPLLVLVGCYGFWFARVNHLLDFTPATYWLFFITVLDLLWQLTAQKTFFWDEYFKSRALILPYIWIGLVVCDALYRRIFPERVTWSAWLSPSALCNHTVRTGFVMAIYVAFLLVVIQQQMTTIAARVFDHSGFIGVISSVLAFQAVPLLISGIHFKRQWAVIAGFSSFLAAVPLLNTSGFLVGVGCNFLLSSLFWCFGLWPTVLAEVIYRFVLLNPDQMMQVYLASTVFVLMVLMIAAQIVFTPIYLSIGSFSIKTSRPMRFFEPPNPGAVSTVSLLAAIFILGLGMQWSEYVINQQIYTKPMSYEQVLLKNSEVLRNHGIRTNGSTQVDARMTPIDLSSLQQMRTDDWKKLIPAFIPWGCWQVITRLNDRGGNIYQINICHQDRWTQIFHLTPQGADMSMAPPERDIARMAIQDAVNIPPDSLEYKQMRLDPTKRGWLLDFDIKEYVKRLDLNLYAQVGMSHGEVSSVKFKIEQPQSKSTAWQVFSFLNIHGINKFLLISSLFAGIMIYGRRINRLFTINFPAVVGFAMSGATALVFYQQSIMHLKMEQITINPWEQDLYYVVPIIKVTINAFLVFLGIRGFVQLLRYSPPVNFLATITMGALGTTFWVVVVFLSLFCGDSIALEASRLWVYFLPHSSLYFTCVVIMFWLLALIISVFWGRVLQSSRWPLHLAFILICSLGFIDLSYSPLQAISIVSCLLIVYPLVCKGVGWYGLRSLVPLISFPMIYWLSWVISTSQFSIKLGGLLILCVIFSGMIASMVYPRCREREDEYFKY
mgnify:CR=1 FL=1|tara:strand:- start:1183 stop:3552 length:2370 start_codon:yes stop_codon:yes gene_type:complete